MLDDASYVGVHAAAGLAVVSAIPLLLCGLGCVFRRKSKPHVPSKYDDLEKDGFDGDGGLALSEAEAVEDVASTVLTDAITSAMAILKTLSLETAETDSLKGGPEPEGTEFEQGETEDTTDLGGVESTEGAEQPAPAESSDDGVMDYADTEEDGTPLEKQERQSRIKAGYKRWRKDEVVKTEIIAAFEGLHPPESLGKLQTAKVMKALARAKWRALPPDRKKFWIMSAVMKLSGPPKRNHEKLKWHTEISRNEGMPWGFRLENVEGKGYTLVAFSTAENAKVLEAQGLTVGVIIDKINGTSIGGSTMAEVETLLSNRIVLLSLRDPSAPSAPEKKQPKWTFTSVNVNESAQKRQARQEAEREAAQRATERTTELKRKSTRRKLRASMRQASVQRREERRTAPNAGGSSDDSTDVEADTETDDGLDELDEEFDDDFGIVTTDFDPADEFGRLFGESLDEFLNTKETVVLTRTSRSEKWGVVLEPTDNGLAVISIEPGTIAAECGLLQTGLLIDEINNVIVKNLTITEIADLMVQPLEIIFTLQDSVDDINFEDSPAATTTVTLPLSKGEDEFGFEDDE